MMVRAMLRTGKLPVITAKPDGQNAQDIAASIRVISTRYQDAVPFYIENGFAQAGATAAKSVVKSWTDKGGKVLAQSRAVPIKQWLVSNTMPADEQDRIRTALLGAGQSKPGRDALDAIGYKGFVATNPEVEASTIAWLGL
jgi:ABC-type phosphate/phosphonate transport system substrate-binding protein